MKRAFKWATLALIVVEAALVRFDLLDIRAAIGIIVAVEALLLLVAVRHVVVASRTYRRDRKAGRDGWTSLENGLEVFLPRKAARVLASELKLWFYLGAWLSRRVRKDENSFSYSGKSMLGAFLVVLLFTTPVEIFLAELLLPWAWLRWLLAVAAVYGFFWVVGLYASMAALPHRLGPDSIRLSYGILARAEIPYSEISEAALCRNDIPLRGDGLKVAREEQKAYMSIGGSTEVVLRLRSPQVLQGWLAPTPPVTSIYLAADKPGLLLENVRKRLGSRIQPVS